MKIMKSKLLPILLTVLLLIPFTAGAMAAEDDTIGIILQIEGIDENLFFDYILSLADDTVYLIDILEFLDENDDDIEIKGLDEGYVKSINGEAAGKFGGWDGWLYMVNGTEPSVGIDEYEIEDGDYVLLYYGDPYGAGMQFPVPNLTGIKDGIIKFTSSDTTYDSEFNPTTTVNPVEGAKVFWGYDNKTAEYTTDSEGVITIDKTQLTPGMHTLQISKNNEAGLPLVLRFAPGYSAAVPGTIGITFRIEGIGENHYFDTVEIPFEDDYSLQFAIDYLNKSNTTLDIKGIDTAYITEINGDTAGKFGGWDGWLYMVNGTEPMFGIDECMLEDGDYVLLYYGDPYGEGMQFPEVDYSRISEGIIKFTSSDTVYDEDWSPSVTVNPIAGATVIWSYGDKTAEYTTDENGEVKIAASQLTEGKHTVQINKYSEDGLPLVLRLEKGFEISIAGTTPPSGDSGTVMYIIISLAALAIFASVINHNKKTGYETK